MTIEADQIPVVELDDLGSHNTARRERATSALRRAFGEFGLVYVRGHGIESAALDDFYSAFLDFTARPEAEKARVARPDIWYQRGWTPPNTEKAVIAGGQPDFKECYFAAPEPFDPIARVQYPQIFADNVWPENASGFKDGLLSLGHSLHEVGMKLLRGGAVALGESGRWGEMVRLRDGKIEGVPIADAIATYRQVDSHSELLRTARAVGIEFGG